MIGLQGVDVGDTIVTYCYCLSRDPVVRRVARVTARYVIDDAGDRWRKDNGERPGRRPSWLLMQPYAALYDPDEQS